MLKVRAESARSSCCRLQPQPRLHVVAPSHTFSSSLPDRSDAIWTRRNVRPSHQSSRRHLHPPQIIKTHPRHATVVPGRVPTTPAGPNYRTQLPHTQRRGRTHHTHSRRLAHSLTPTPSSPPHIPQVGWSPPSLRTQAALCCCVLKAPRTTGGPPDPPVESEHHAIAQRAAAGLRNPYLHQLNPTTAEAALIPLSRVLWLAPPARVMAIADTFWNAIFGALIAAGLERPGAMERFSNTLERPVPGWLAPCIKYYSPKMMQIDYWLVGLINRVLQILVLVYVCINLFLGNTWVYAETPLGTVNAYGSEGASMKSIYSQAAPLTDKVIYCGNESYAFEDSASFNYTVPDCRYVIPEQLVTKGESSVTFTTVQCRDCLPSTSPCLLRPRHDPGSHPIEPCCRRSTWKSTKRAGRAARSRPTPPTRTSASPEGRPSKSCPLASACAKGRGRSIRSESTRWCSLCSTPVRCHPAHSAARALPPCSRCRSGAAARALPLGRCRLGAAHGWVAPPLSRMCVCAARSSPASSHPRRTCGHL